MLTEHKQRLQMFRRVRDFLRAAPVAAEVEPALATLERLIARLDEHAAQQDHRSRQSRAGTERSRGLARTLRADLMRPISLIARSVFTAPGAEGDALRRGVTMPRAQDYEGLVATAQGMVRLVTEHEAQFIAAGLPKGHLQRLADAAEALKASVATRSVAVGRRSAATSGARADAKEGLLAVRILETLVVPSLRDDPARLAEWRSATSMARTGGARDATGEETPAPVDSSAPVPLPVAPAINDPNSAQEVKAA